MKRRILELILLGLLVGCSPAGTSTSINPETYSHSMRLDLYHGSMDQTLKSAIERSGIQIQNGDTPITDQSLQTVGILWITDTASRDYQPNEIKSVKNFVQSGGTLICSGQAWSWLSDKKDLEKYPLNQLGKSLGFTITGQNIGKPVTTEQLPYLLGVQSLAHTDWWPSMVESQAAGFQPLIRDGKMKTMAIFIPSGKGRIFVFGHGSLLRDNPEIALNILTRSRT